MTNNSKADELKLTDKSKIRHAVMSGKGYAIRDLLLTFSQIELVEKVGKKECMTAHELSTDLGVSIQNASSKLNRLYRAGYLERVTISARSQL